MTAPQTREALAVERDRLADTIMRFLVFSPESRYWGGQIERVIAQYAALSAVINQRGEPVQPARIGGEA